MPNDYARFRRAAHRAMSLPVPPQPVVNAVPAQLAALPAVNDVGMGRAHTTTVNPTNLPVLNVVSGLIIGEEDPNVIRRMPTVPDRKLQMAVKLVFSYRVNNKAYSEIWYAPVNALDVITQGELVNYITTRLAWSGQQTVFRRVRLTLLGTRNISVSFSATNLMTNGAPLLATDTGSFPTVGAISGETDSPNTCFTTECVSANRSRRMFLRGIPDAMSVRGGLVATNPAFNALFRTWTEVPIGLGWGWTGQPTTPYVRVQITAINNPTGNLVFTLAGAGITWPSTRPTPIRIRNLPHPWAYLNGPMVVIPGNNANTATSLRAFPMPAGNPPAPTVGQMYLQVPIDFFTCTSIGISDIGERKAGGSSDRSRGRARNRVFS